MADLEELAREGEATRASVAARQAEEERRARVQQNRELRRLGVTHLLTALDERPRAYVFPLLRWTMTAVGISMLLWLAGSVFGGPDALEYVGLTGMIGLPILYFGARRWRGVAELRRERAWLRSLPFPVRGYFALLTGTPSEECSVRARISLAHEGPEEALMLGLAGRTGTAVEVHRVAGGWEVESGAIESPVIGEDSAATNGALLSWMRSLLTETALPLHGADHRVLCVRFRN